MKPLDPEIVAKTATLARLKLSTDEQTRLSHDLGEILALFDLIDLPDIHALAPLAHPLNEHQPLREDIAIPCDMTDSIAKNAPAAENGFITVPKVIE